MRRKLICWILAIVLVISCAPTALAADVPQRPQREGLPSDSYWHDPNDEGGITIQSADDWQDYRDVTYLTDGDWQYYVNDDDNATITDYLGGDTQVTTPEKVGGKNVTIIGTGTFEDEDDIESVIIRENVTQLGDIEFEDGYGVPFIYGSVFYNTHSLETISLPSTLAILGENSFSFCWDLKTITVASGNLNFRIDNGVLFSGASNKVLECYPAQKADLSYVIPSGIEKIAPRAVCLNNFIEEITIPGSVTEMYNGIENCSGLKTVHFEDGITSIRGFYNCINLETVDLPDTLTKVDEFAFEECESLTSITLPSGLQSIEWGAFFNSGLTSVTIPPLVDDIGGAAFAGCFELSAFNVDPASTYHKSVDGVLFSIDGAALEKYPCGKNNPSYTVPNGTTAIYDYAFFSAGLEQVNLPESLRYICSYAFAWNNLTNITLPQGLHSIYWSAFMGNNLTNVTIPHNTVEIGAWAFAENPNLSQFIVYSDNVDLEELTDTDLIFENSHKLVLYGNPGSKTQAYAKKFDLPFSIIPSAVSMNSSATLLKGTTGKLSAATTPTGGLVTWISHNPSIVSVDGIGNITANAVGTATITATCLDKSANCTINVINPIPVGLSYTKTDATIYGAANGSVTITASGGNSGSYEYSLDNGASWQAANTFGSLGANTYTAAVRDAAFPTNTAATVVTVGQPTYMGQVPAAKIAPKVNAGSAVTVVPPAPPKGYTTQSTTYASSNPAIATVDANGNVSFIAGGKVTIITKVVSQTVDKKGKVKTKITTVKKSITVQQPISYISLNLADTTIARTQKVKLTATIAPATATNKKLKWTSSNPKVAAVSGAGVVTGKAGGTAVITCTAADGSGVVARCTVTVTPIYPTAIKMSKTALTVKPGKTAALKATITPKNTDFKTITWVSSNPAVATVDAKGKVKGISAGTAVITAATSSGQIAGCSVTVP